jgi:hypothetical protein
MQRFNLGKNAAIGVAMGLLGTLSLVTVFCLYERITHLSDKLPIYQDHFMVLYEKVLSFLYADGINVVSHSSTELSSSDRFLALSRLALPGAGRVLSDGLLISILGLIFLIIMVENPDAKRTVRSDRLHSQSDDVRRYIAISARLEPSLRWPTWYSCWLLVWTSR